MSFSFRKKRPQLLAGPFPEPWLPYLQENVFLYRLLSEPEQEKLRDTLRIFVAEKYWEGCGGLQITDEIRVTIAAQACLLLLGFDDYCFDELKTVLVYPGGYLADDSSEHTNRVSHRAGESHQGGPVVLSWWDSRWYGRQFGPRNLVIHEFAHQLAARGEPDAGMPPIDDPDLEHRWLVVMTAERARLAEDADYGRSTLLDPYGATDAAEFFAVATECFFQQPVPLRDQHPSLYQVLLEWYHQDPANRRTPDENEVADAERAQREHNLHIIAECTAALHFRPESTDAYSVRAGLYCEQGEYDKAIADYHAVIRLGPANPETYCERGTAYRAIGRLDLAIADFSTAIRLCPDYSWAFYERAVAHAGNGDLDQALADLGRAIHADPKNDAAYHQRGLVYHDQGKYQKAVADFTKAIELWPRWATAYSDRALSLIAMGEYHQAIADCGEAIKLDSSLPEPYKHRGVAHTHNRDFEEALVDLTEAIRLDPEYIEALHARGDAYAASGRKHEAQMDYTRAEQLVSQTKGGSTE